MVIAWWRKIDYDRLYFLCSGDAQRLVSDDNNSEVPVVLRAHRRKRSLKQSLDAAVVGGVVRVSNRRDEDKHDGSRLYMKAYRSCVMRVGATNKLRPRRPRGKWWRAQLLGFALAPLPRLPAANIDGIRTSSRHESVPVYRSDVI